MEKQFTTKEQVMKEFEKILSAYNAEILNKYQDEYLMEKGPGCEQVLFPVLEKAKKDFLEVPNDGYIKHPGDVLKDFSSTYDTAYEKGVRDAMERIGEDIEITCDLPDIVKMCNKCEEAIVINKEKSRLRLALSELLKK